MIDSNGFADLRNYTARRLGYARYRVGSTWYKTSIEGTEILSSGIVRAKLVIAPGDAVTVNRVELYNNAAELWAHQNCNIAISANQQSILFWFDFTFSEG